MNFRYSVTFYDPYDDGSHPFGDPHKRFNTPEEAFEYGQSEVDKAWQAERCRATDLDWFDEHVEKNIFIVQVHYHEPANDNA